MKKVFILLIFIISLLSVSSCKKAIYSDGLIEYHTLGKSFNVYSLTEEGKQQEYIIIPSYVNGNKVEVDSRTSGFDDYGNVKKVYVPYTITYWENSALNPDEAKVFVFSNQIHKNMSEYMNLYVSSWLFENVNLVNELNHETIGWSILYDAHIANVSFHFNHENAPNEGYYWLDDYDYGELITFTPPNPSREGYTFAGWYKEPECINEWIFNEDKLPELKYDETGDIIFNETELYAKWLD